MSSAQPETTFVTVTDEEAGLRARLERLIEKWRADRATYPEEQFGAQWAYVAVKVCEDELRAVLDGRLPA